MKIIELELTDADVGMVLSAVTNMSYECHQKRYVEMMESFDNLYSKIYGQRLEQEA